MKNQKMIALFILLFVGCCTPEQSTVAEYSIENGLNIPITLQFFRNGLPSVGTAPVSLRSSGATFKKAAESLGSSTSPFDVFKADSILIVFNGERAQGHNLFEPAAMCLLNQEDYEKLGDGKFLYRVNQANLDASILCKNGCN